MLAFLKMPVTAKQYDYEKYSDRGCKLQEHKIIWRITWHFSLYIGHEAEKCNKLVP